MEHIVRPTSLKGPSEEALSQFFSDEAINFQPTDE